MILKLIVFSLSYVHFLHSSMRRWEHVSTIPDTRIPSDQIAIVTVGFLCGGRVQRANCCSGPGTVGGFSNPRNRVRGDRHSHGSENISLRDHISVQFLQYVPPVTLSCPSKESDSIFKFIDTEILCGTYRNIFFDIRTNIYI